MSPSPVPASRSRALVTGVAGFIGSHVAEALLQSGCAVRGVDCFSDNYARPQKLANLRHLADWEAFEFVPIDLARGSLHDLVEDCDTVAHLAAEPGVRSSWGARYEHYLRNNVLATQHLLEAVRDVPALRFVHASSSSVYGEGTVRPTAEHEPPRPRSPYGQTKIAAEHLCDLYHANFGVDAVRLRYFTVFGPRQRPDMAFQRICSAALAGDTFEIYGDGRQTRDFSYVDDVVAATLAAARFALDGQRVFNVGGGSPASLVEAVAVVAELSGRPVQVSHLPTEHGDVRHTAADITLARRVLGFVPSVSLADGLTRQFEWLLAGPSAR